MGSPTISPSKIQQAAGDNAALREILEQIALTTAQTQQATGTTPVSGSADVQKAAAPVPAQATGYVSVLGTTYTVQIINPGATSPLSQVQASESGLTPAQPTVPIFHQIRASTSPAFNVNSNTQTFGGNSGSTQTYWSLQGLGKGTWYFQFRSSFDGVNFNQWKNANSGAGVGKIVDQVTLENSGNSEWALFTMPGSMIMGIGTGEMADQEVFGLAQEVYSSGMVAIASPNGFPPQNPSKGSIALSDVDIQTPSTGTVGVTGVPDFPVVVRCLWNQADSTTQWPSNAAVFAIAFDPSNPNVKLYPSAADGPIWAVMRLPGGGRIALGQGKNQNGEAITPPPVTWFSNARFMSITAITDGAQSQPAITGFGQSQIDASLTLRAAYLGPSGALFGDGVSANWIAIAWEQGVDVVVVNGIPFVKIQLQGGHAVVIGAGQIAEGQSLQLPPGYDSSNILSICTPAGSDNTGHHLLGVQQCSLNGLEPVLTYIDNSGNTWSGPANVMVCAWK